MQADTTYKREYDGSLVFGNTVKRHEGRKNTQAADDVFRQHYCSPYPRRHNASALQKPGLTWMEKSVQRAVRIQTSDGESSRDDIPNLGRGGRCRPNPRHGTDWDSVRQALIQP